MWESIIEYFEEWNEDAQNMQNISDKSCEYKLIPQVGEWYPYNIPIICDVAENIIFDKNIYPEIIKYLDIGDILSLILVNTKYRRIFKRDDIWTNYVDDNILEFCKYENIFDRYVMLCYIRKDYRYWYSIEKITKFNRLFVSKIDEQMIKNIMICFSELSSLKFSGIIMERIPEEIKYMHNLRELDISNNIISEISDELCYLTNLEKFSAKNNNIQTLPELIRGMRNLTKLDLTFNRMQIFPKQIFELSNLEIIDLKFNKIEKIPDCRHFPNVRYFDLMDNRMKRIPKIICLMTSLVYLDMSQNLIKEIPNMIGNLENLEILKLSWNFINIIPECVKNLRNIKKIELRGNYIQEIPQIIICLKNLEEIDLRKNKNKIGKIPEFIKNSQIKIKM